MQIKIVSGKIKHRISSLVSRYRRRPIELVAATGSDVTRKPMLVKIYASRSDPFAQNFIIRILREHFDYFIGYVGKGYSGPSLSEGIYIFEVLSETDMGKIRKAAAEIRKNCKGSVFISVYGGKSL